MSLGVTGLADLVSILFGEPDHEYSHDGSVQGLHLTDSFDQGLPLADEVAQFVTGHVQTIERGTAETAFNVFHLKFHFSPGLIFSYDILRGKICKTKIMANNSEKLKFKTRTNFPK